MWWCVCHAKSVNNKNRKKKLLATNNIIASYKKLTCIHVYAYDKNIGKGSTKASEAHEKVGHFIKSKVKFFRQMSMLNSREKATHVSSQSGSPSKVCPICIPKNSYCNP